MQLSPATCSVHAVWWLISAIVKVVAAYVVVHNPLCRRILKLVSSVLKAVGLKKRFVSKTIVRSFRQDHACLDNLLKPRQLTSTLKWMAHVLRFFHL